MTGRLIRLLLAALLPMVVVLVPSPASAGVPDADHVIVIGVPGLRWDDVTAETTPNLYQLAESGAIGTMSVRSAAGLTCPVDGWVTLGAGNRAQGQPHSRFRCVSDTPVQPPVANDDGSAYLPQQNELVALNERKPHGARPGSLASSLKCVSAIGVDAGFGAARTTGAIDTYYEEMPADPAGVFTRCPLTLVDVGDVRGPQRERTLPGIDATVGQILAARPPNTMIMVVGVSDVSYPSQLHVAMVDGPGYENRWLHSASTGREPYVQLIDVAATVLDSQNVGVPSSIVGQSMTPGQRRNGDTEESINTLVDANDRTQAARPLIPLGYRILVLVNVALMVVATVFFRRRQLAVTETLPDPAAGHTGRPHLFGTDSERRFARWLAGAGLFVGALPVAGYLANALPWWRWSIGTAIFIISIVVIAGGITVAAARGPWRQHPLGAPGFVAAVSALTLGLDVVTGSHLQLDALGGYSPLVAGRFTGFGNMGWALFAAGVVLGVAYAVATLQPWHRAIAIGCIGLLAVVITGAPWWGNDIGGVLALTPAIVVTALRAAGIWLTPTRVALSLMSGFLVVMVFAIIDYLRPEEDRTHLGRFVSQVLDGTAGTIIRRKAEANFNLLISSPLTLLVIAAILFVGLVLVRRSAGLWRVFGLYPTVRAGVLGALVAAGMGFFLNDSGIAIPAQMVAIGLPLVLATTLRTLAAATRSTPQATATVSAGEASS